MGNCKYVHRQGDKKGSRCQRRADGNSDYCSDHPEGLTRSYYEQKQRAGGSSSSSTVYYPSPSVVMVPEVTLLTSRLSLSDSYEWQRRCSSLESELATQRNAKMDSERRLAAANQQIAQLMAQVARLNEDVLELGAVCEEERNGNKKLQEELETANALVTSMIDAQEKIRLPDESDGE